MNKMYVIYPLTVILMLRGILLFANENAEIGIEHDKYLGKSIPSELIFTDADGQPKKLKNLIDKPTVLALVYYHCPGICSPLLTNLTKVINESEVVLGKDYNILTISFDHTEDSKAAEKWQKSYFSSLNSKPSPDNWHFMVGDSNSIASLTNSVGFFFKPDGNGEYIHAGALIILSPSGKITRYLLGTTYLPFDYKMAIVEAGKEISTPPINKLLEFCYSYDPKGQKYVLNVNRIAGSIVFLSAGLLFTILILKGRKKKS